jgi:Flp pilus assembly CpaE family ATPase
MGEGISIVQGPGVPCILPQPVLRVLLIEDNPGDAELVKETLSAVGPAEFQIHWTQALLPGLDRLAAGDIDLVLLDMSLPDSRGLDGLKAIRIHAPHVPVVLLTGLDNESLALRAMQSGAQDYLVKGTLMGAALARILQHAIVRHQIHAESPLPASVQQQAKVLGFLGAKGGVGVTTIACHIAAELKRQTAGRVLVMDLDLSGNSMGFLMQAETTYGILEASNDILHLDEVRWEKLTSKVAGGLEVVLSRGPTCSEEDQPRAERVGFVLRFVRSLYEWIIVDLGRLSPFSARVAKEASRLYLVSTCDLLGLAEAKSTARALFELGFDSDRMALVLNQATARVGFSQRELERMLGVPVEAMLPECRQDFADSLLDGKRLGESRKFQKRVAEWAAGITGAQKEAPAPTPRLPFLSGAIRSAPTGT